MTSSQGVLATLNYVKRFQGTTVLIKLGGAALQDSELVQQICEDLTLIRSVGVSVVLVHGGGPSINHELQLRGINWEFIDGQRVTTPEMMDVIEMGIGIVQVIVILHVIVMTVLENLALMN